MARRQQAAPVPQPANLRPEQMRAALPKLERRAKELREFDVATINDRGDVRADALRRKYSATIVDIFGVQSREYTQYEIHDFDRASLNMYGGTPIDEVRAGYREGMDEALAHLQTIREIFEERLEEADDGPGPRAVRAFGELDIHPVIADAAGELFDGGHYANAVEDACKALNRLVQKRIGRTDLDGTALMQQVFSPNQPTLLVADPSSPSAGDEQKGAMMLAAGAMLFLRNPRAHELRADDPERAIEYIATLSMLAKIVDEAHQP